MSLNLPPRSIHFEAVLEYPDGTSRRLVSCTYYCRFFARRQVAIAEGDSMYANTMNAFPGTENLDSVLLSATVPWTAYPDGMPSPGNNGMTMRPGGFLFLSTGRTPNDTSNSPGVYYQVPAPPRDARVDCWAWTNVIDSYQVC